MSQSKHANQKLTVKQNDFCHKFLELKSASAAYRAAYDAEKSKPETVHRRASELLDNGKVQARLNELRSKADKHTEITLEEVSTALRTALDQALERGQSGAAVAAAMGLGKLGGLVTDRQRIETVDEGQAHLEALQEMTENREKLNEGLKVVNGGRQ
jgi:phage terminase small subunit